MVGPISAMYLVGLIAYIVRIVTNRMSSAMGISLSWRLLVKIVAFAQLIAMCSRSVSSMSSTKNWILSEFKWVIFLYGEKASHIGPSPPRLARVATCHLRRNSKILLRFALIIPNGTYVESAWMMHSLYWCGDSGLGSLVFSTLAMTPSSLH